MKLTEDEILLMFVQLFEFLILENAAALGVLETVGPENWQELFDRSKDSHRSLARAEMQPLYDALERGEGVNGLGAALLNYLAQRPTKKPN